MSEFETESESEPESVTASGSPADGFAFARRRASSAKAYAGRGRIDDLDLFEGVKDRGRHGADGMPRRDLVRAALWMAALLGQPAACSREEAVVLPPIPAPPGSAPATPLPSAPTEPYDPERAQQPAAADTSPRAEPHPTVPAAPPEERHREEPVECGGMTLYGMAPRTWVRGAAAVGECTARWTVPAPNGARAWVIVHCLPAGRVGLAELDAWYQLFRQPDGSPMPELGTGRASLSSTCEIREVGIDVRGTLVQPIACAPLPPPAPDTALQRRVLEAPRARFVFDLLGPPATLELELQGVSGDTRWYSSIAADFTSFVASMRATSAPTETSAYRRPCP